MFLQTLDILTQMLALLARLISVFIMDIMFKHERVNYCTRTLCIAEQYQFCNCFIRSGTICLRHSGEERLAVN